MSNPSQTNPAASRTGRRFLWQAMFCAVVLLLSAGLMLAGAYWHRAIGGWLGWSEEAHGIEAPDLAAGQQRLYGCGMHPQVIQEKPGICPICHMKLEPVSVTNGPAKGAGGKRKIKYWWDPMLGPSSISDKPGKSAMGMDLVPVYEDQVSGGATVTIDPVVVQNMGVRVVEVMRGSVQRTIRAVGYLDEAQPNIHDVNLRVSGWIEKLYADTEGKHLAKGDPLFELYSPELQVAVEELIAAQGTVQSLSPRTDEFARRNAGILVESARRKMEQWGLDPVEIDRLAKLDSAPRVVSFFSPMTGHVVEKHVVEGAAVKAGDRVLRIVDHSTLWLDVQVFEQDLPFVRMGQKVTATVKAGLGKEFKGEVLFIHPHLDPTTRTTTVRMALPNPELVLRPGMFATVNIDAELREPTPLVPREAVIDTGSRQVAFVAAGQGRFEPRSVKLGVSGSDGTTQVLTGLVPGELVVTSGQFLLDAESRMRESIQRHLDQRLLSKRQVSAPAPSAAEAQSQTVPTEPDLSLSAAAGRMPWSPEVDAVYRQYLTLAQAFGSSKPPESSIDMDKLIASAKALTQATAASQEPRLPPRILDAANAMRGKSVEDQRKLLKALSEAVVAMTQTTPPSDAVAKELFVVYCPMKKAHWLQVKPDIANPYYATEMKECGQVKRTLKPTPAPK